MLVFSRSHLDWSPPTGIVYCLSRKDCETVAENLRNLGEIAAAAYHSDLTPEEKMDVHTRWNSGEVKVVVATIAFGMGIDKPDVRFVIHAILPKSMEGLYQESGRAGRDGLPADCVLFYRPQDATRVAGVCSDARTGPEKCKWKRLRDFQSITDLDEPLVSACSPQGARVLPIHALPQAALRDLLSRQPQHGHVAMRDLRQLHRRLRCGAQGCQLVLLRATEWSECDADALHLMIQVTFESWQILQAVRVIDDEAGRVTLSALSDLVLGKLGGKFNTQKGKKKKAAKGVGTLDMASFGGKVALHKDVGSLRPMV